MRPFRQTGSGGNVQARVPSSTTWSSGWSLSAVKVGMPGVLGIQSLRNARPDMDAQGPRIAIRTALRVCQTRAGCLQA